MKVGNNEHELKVVTELNQPFLLHYTVAIGRIITSEEKLSNKKIFQKFIIIDHLKIK